MSKRALTLSDLKKCTYNFVLDMSETDLPDLFGITDGKAVGTYVEHKFHDYLKLKFTYDAGNSARGIDFPKLDVDLKVTSIRQPQSSCPFRSANQKVFGLGYNLIIFVYEKKDDALKRVTRLNFLNAIFVDKEYTADYQTTHGLLDILSRDANKEDIIAFLTERRLPLDEIGYNRIAEQILKNQPKPGYLTISNALQWRLQYGRIVTIVNNGGNEGVENLIRQF